MSQSLFRRWWACRRELLASPALARRRVARHRWTQLAIDPLEDRRLLTTSVSPVADPAAIVAGPAAIVGREIFYNNSAFDGHNVGANAADDGAIATDKSALLPGQTATFANYTSYSAGINGIMIDVSGMRGTPTADDFQFRTGNNNDPATWNAAPAPTSITVRHGAGVGGSDRITIIWPDGNVRGSWLQVNVLPTYTMGLRQADVFYFGNAIGESGDSPTRATVNVTDQLGPRYHPASSANPVPITSPWDYNRDRLVNSTDIFVARNHTTSGATALQVITPQPVSSPTVVRGRSVFYNDSVFDGYDPAAGPADDLAIATDKTALLPGQAATFGNYTSYSRGLNGIMIDIAGLSGTLSSDDFEFRVGNNNTPASWSAGAPPESISLRAGAGVDGSTRVTLIWPDDVIKGVWLQVTVKANSHTGLVAADRFYFGNAVGESGDSFKNALVNTTDQAKASSLATTAATVTSPCDFNRDGVVDQTDVQISRANQAGAANALVLLNFSPPSPDVAADGSAAYTDFVNATVVGRYVFYNNSAWDGNNPAANGNDDLAIATDKQALLPGQTASLANYTTYSRGLTGIMIDIMGLPQNLNRDDFVFRVGTSGDPAGWGDAPALASISVRYGQGVGGSDRVTVLWPDNWISDSWLQVTVKATSRTGLSRDDVFYFGNVIGESGNSASDAYVTTTDQLLVRQAAGGPAPITSRFDFNRDGQIDSTDEAIARDWPNRTMSLLHAPAAPAVAAQPGMQPAFFNRGDGGYFLTFGPDLVRTTSGTILAFAEGRSGELDPTAYALVLRRSTDGGGTWTPISTIFSVPPDSGTIVHHPSAVVDQATGTIHVLFTIDNSLVYVMNSSDDGLTWSSAVDITSAVKVTANGNPNSAMFPNSAWDWYAVGPTNGIQLQIGAHAGRLVIPADHRLVGDTEGTSWSHIIYSDDHGATWHLGGGLDQTIEDNNDSNEAAVIELPDGSLYMTIRVNNNEPTRGISHSYDGGNTWTTLTYDPTLTSARVSGSLLRLDASTILYAGPDTLQSPNRHGMTIWVSRDNAQTWVKTKVVYYGYAGYSDMVLAGNDTVLLAYNGGQADGDSTTYMALARFNLRWLLDTAPPQFSWYFNEQAPGTAANIAGPTLRDTSAYDNRAWAQAATAGEAPRYVAGANAGDSALRLTTGSDAVILAPALTDSLQFRETDSFTAEVVLRTAVDSGVIIGSLPNQPNWALTLVGGKVQCSLNDMTASVSITSNRTINDGLWHRVEVVRDATRHLVVIYIDGVKATALTADPTLSLRNQSAVTLGAYSDGTAQLSFDVDSVRVTRGAVAWFNFLPANFVAPPPPAVPDYGADSPRSISGLKLWLPAFDPTTYFADRSNSAPVVPAPQDTTAVRSGYDASDNHFRVSVASDTRQLLYAKDSVVGSNWLDNSATPAGGNEWVVSDSSGASANNFDFVQDTGVFTISTFIKPGASLGSGYMALFDTSESTSNHAGFSFTLTDSGAIRMQISDNAGNTRIMASSPSGLVSTSSWFHVVVVGHGAGQPLTFYVTPASSTVVQSYVTSKTIVGPDGNYATDADHNLSIGAQSHTGLAAYNGQIVDQAIFSRALSEDEIQQLFDFTKKNSTA
jgi:sialidase-1